jgi:hypothetical protein
MRNRASRSDFGMAMEYTFPASHLRAHAPGHHVKGFSIHRRRVFNRTRDWCRLCAMSGESEFLEHAAMVRDYASMNLSEADTRVHLIDPVLAILGYRAVGDIRREVPVPATREFIDYQLMAGDQPQAIVEAKAVRHAITDQHVAQCVQYASVLGVRWCLITNGSVVDRLRRARQGPPGREARRAGEARPGRAGGGRSVVRAVTLLAFLTITVSTADEALGTPCSCR